MAIKNITNNMNQGQGQQMNPLAPAPLVQQAAQQSFAMKNGGQLPQAPMQGAPSGGIAPVAPTPVNYFQSGGGINGKFDLTPDTPAPAPEYGAEGVKVTESPADVKQNDLSSLSAALSNVGGQQQPQFTSDPNQRDGGFFGWLKGLAPKLRPGRREGETDDEYDRRITTNRENMAVLADAMRHMGNIINTSKYAPAQQFNDPTTAMEQGYQQRRAQRQKKAALDADQAQKAAELSLKQRAQDVDNAYKQWLMGMKEDAAKLNQDKFDWRKGRDERDFNHKTEREAVGDAFKEKKFQADQQQRATSNSLRAQTIAKKGSGGGGRGGRGSGGKYKVIDKEGKVHYFDNKTMYEWGESYYNGIDSGNSSTSTSSKTFDKNGEHTTTNRKGGSSVAQRAGALARKRAEARNANSQPKKNTSSKGKGGNSFKNFKL